MEHSRMSKVALSRMTTATQSKMIHDTSREIPEDSSRRKSVSPKSFAQSRQTSIVQETALADDPEKHLETVDHDRSRSWEIISKKSTEKVEENTTTIVIKSGKKMGSVITVQRKIPSVSPSQVTPALRRRLTELEELWDGGSAFKEVKDYIISLVIEESKGLPRRNSHSIDENSGLEDAPRGILKKVDGKRLAVPKYQRTSSRAVDISKIVESSSSDENSDSDDNSTSLGEKSRETEKLVEKSRETEKLVEKSRETEKLVEKSRETEKLVEKSRETEKLVENVVPLESNPFDIELGTELEQLELESHSEDEHHVVENMVEQPNREESSRNGTTNEDHEVVEETTVEKTEEITKKTLMTVDENREMPIDQVNPVKRPVTESSEIGVEKSPPKEPIKETQPIRVARKKQAKR